MKKLILYILAFLASSQILVGAEVDFFTDGTFIVPDGVAAITVHVWGAGGGGGGANTSGKAGGGGGGAYARKDIVVSPGQNYTITVGSGGSGGDGTTGGAGGSGGSSLFAALVQAAGGSGGGGSLDNAIPGAAGSGGLAGGTGDVDYAGGSGAAGITDTSSGGGGGAAGTDVPGGSAAGATGGAGGLSGGNGSDGLISEAIGNPGFAPGGGGSGAFGGVATAYNGGNGAGGLVKVVSAAPLIGITKDRDLSFGAFVVAGAGTVTVAADAGGARSKSGSITLAGSNSSLCAQFTVIGASNHFIATLVAPPANITSGANNIPVAFAIGYENQNSAANTKVYVGGTLTLVGTEPAGAYSANATISVAYD